ncbi:MAG: YhdH/YhfP family quinone oxidoreductase [Pseudohongiellaceae bacterium]
MSNFKAYQVSEIEEKKFAGELVDRSIDELPEGQVLIRVHYSSVNYKDALSANGNPGVTRSYPHTPGIDAAGVVESSDSAQFSKGDEVIVVGYDLGMNTAGGFGQYIRVPENWVISLPKSLTLKDSMVLGTAGFTAALCVEKLLHNGLVPDDGKVLVTGATGGVGVVAVSLLSKLGFEVTASTSKKSAHSLLTALGATEIINRDDLSEENRKPMLAEQWAGAVDVVGGATLFNVVKSLKYGGSVAACGLVQSPMFQASVLPFILRNVNLLGIDSVQLPIETKRRVWQKMGDQWRLENLDRLSTEIEMEDLPKSLETVYKGGATGRFVVNLKAK